MLRSSLKCIICLKKLCLKNDKIIWNRQSLSPVADGIDRWDCENPLKSLENFSLNPSTPMSDQDRIFLTIAIQYQPDSDENKKKISIWG